MRAFVILAAVSALAAAHLNLNINLTQEDLFRAWRVQWMKAYSTPEEASMRFAIFKANLARVNAHNAREETYTMAMNEFGDLTPREFGMARIGGAKVPKLRGQRGQRPEEIPVVEGDVSALPNSVDWTTKGVVTPVKNQGQCGSCWAFSSTGAMESINAINGKGLKSLSEQQLVDCAGPFGAQGCNGGWMDDAFAYVISNKGICSEASYPYTAVDGTCKASTCTNIVSIKSFTDVTPKSDVALATAVVQQPTSIVVEADQSSFQFYSSGVLTSACGDNIDHAILAVGYGTSNGIQYYKVKNSWGAAWGMSGYILLARGTSYNGGVGQCGLYYRPSYPNQ